MYNYELIRLHMEERWREAENSRLAWAALTRRMQAGTAAARRSIGLCLIRAGWRVAAT